MRTTKTVHIATHRKKKNYTEKKLSLFGWTKTLTNSQASGMQSINYFRYVFAHLLHNYIISFNCSSFFFSFIHEEHRTINLFASNLKYFSVIWSIFQEFWLCAAGILEMSSVNHFFPKITCNYWASKLCQQSTSLECGTLCHLFYFNKTSGKVEWKHVGKSILLWRSRISSILTELRRIWRYWIPFISEW